MNDGIRKKLKVIALLTVLIIVCVGYLFLECVTRSCKKEVEPMPTPIVTPVVEPTIEPTPEITQEPTQTPVAVDIDSDDSINKIVNKERKIPDTYVPELVNIDKKNMLRPEAAEAYEEMVEAAKADGINIVAVSGYRSYKYQRSLWFTYEEKYGRKYANRMDATPGASEHQLGLAVDLVGADGKCKLYNCFKNTSTSKWLVENSYKYGFILRYPDGKESVTGIMYSPWHYRYIGKEEALKVYESGLTLEEYYDVK
jgi:D-alanyl-D-alanine carboxypeptidase